MIWERERQHGKENAENRFVGGRIWIASEDVGVVPEKGGTLILNPWSKTIKVDISDLRKETPEEVHDSVFFSTRSRFALLGVEVPKEANEILRDSLKKGNGEKVIEIPVINHSGSEFIIPNGMGIGRVLASNGERLTGDALVSWIKHGDIKVGGERNKDWWPIIHKNTGIIGLGMTVNMAESKMRSLPNGKLISMDARQVSPRAEADKWLESFSDKGKPAVWVGEANAVLALGSDVHVIMSSKVGRWDGKHMELSDTARHLSSVWFRGGTRWRIRTETLSATSPDEIPNAILLTFATTGRLAA